MDIIEVREVFDTFLNTEEEKVKKAKEIRDRDISILKNKCIELYENIRTEWLKPWKDSRMFIQRRTGRQINGTTIDGFQTNELFEELSIKIPSINKEIIIEPNITDFTTFSNAVIKCSNGKERILFLDKSDKIYDWCFFEEAYNPVGVTKIKLTESTFLKILQLLIK